MDKSLEKLAEELQVAMPDAVQVFDLGREQQHEADMEMLDKAIGEFPSKWWQPTDEPGLIRLSDNPSEPLFRAFIIRESDWQDFKEGKLG